MPITEDQDDDCSQFKPKENSTNTLELSFNDKFEKERYGRLIDNLTSPVELRKVAKDMLSLYIGQKAAARWAMINAMSAPPRYDNLIPSQEYLDDLHKEITQRQHDRNQPQGEEN